MTSLLDRLACPECDLLMNAPALDPGERAVCPRCGFLLTTCLADPFGRTLAFSISALVFLGIALAFPFLTISASGVENSMTLSQTMTYLAAYGANTIAWLVFIFVILVPAVMLTYTVVLSARLRRGQYSEWMLNPSRWLFHLDSWSMIEVFTIGVIVSLVKIASMARVELGISFWAYLAFTVTALAAWSSLDRLTVWKTLDELRRSR